MHHLIASISTMLIGLLPAVSLILIALLGAKIFYSDLPVKQKFNVFGLFFFLGNGVVLTIYFLISLLPFDKDCYGMVSCQMTSVMNELDAQRWVCFSLALVAFIAAFINYRYIFPTEGKNGGQPNDAQSSSIPSQ